MKLKHVPFGQHTITQPMNKLHRVFCNILTQAPKLSCENIKNIFISLCTGFLLQIGWIYGSVTEDILTGFKMHARGWRSIYCMPHPPAFKGSAPINLSDRLNQVLRWALGSVEILFSRHCPIWYGYSGRLKFLERFAYINTTIYPLTSLPLILYCTLPAVCLLTGKFIIPQVTFLHFPSSTYLCLCGHCLQCLGLLIVENVDRNPLKS